MSLKDHSRSPFPLGRIFLFSFCATIQVHSLEVIPFYVATPVLLPGKSHGQKSLLGCSPGGRKELDRAERLHFHFSLSCIGKEMATHSSVLVWRIPGTGEPGGLPSTGSHRVGHD